MINGKRFPEIISFFMMAWNIFQEIHNQSVTDWDNYPFFIEMQNFQNNL